MQHILRNFLYLDQQLLDDYLSAIGGELFDESVIVERQEVKGAGNIGANIGMVGAGGGISKSTEVESTKQVKRVAAAKFQELYSYLESEEAILFYESMNEDIWNTIKRDQLLECIVSPRFSKMDEMLSLVNQIGSLAGIVETVTGENIIGDDGYEAINGFEAIGQAQQGKGIPCVCSFFDSTKFKLVTYLNPSYLKVSKEQIVGDVTLFCKVQRVLAKGEKIELFELLPGISNFAVNREQRRQMKKDFTAPAELKDTISGPAAIVIPIALYR